MLTSRSPTFQLVVVQRQDALARPAAQPRDHSRHPVLRQAGLLEEPLQAAVG
jgi:hypothetical protein